MSMRGKPDEENPEAAEETGNRSNNSDFARNRNERRNYGKTR